MPSRAPSSSFIRHRRAVIFIIVIIVIIVTIFIIFIITCTGGKHVSSYSDKTTASLQIFSRGVEYSHRSAKKETM